MELKQQILQANYIYYPLSIDKISSQAKDLIDKCHGVETLQKKSWNISGWRMMKFCWTLTYLEAITQSFQSISWSNNDQCCQQTLSLHLTMHTGAFSLVILAAVAARQHSPSSDRLGPTRAHADFTDFKKTALSPYPNNLGSQNFLCGPQIYVQVWI